MSAPSPRPARSVYRVRRAYFLRALGRLALAAAVLVGLSTVCVTLSAPGVLITVVVLLTACVLVFAAVVAVSVLLPPTLLQLDHDGFRTGKRYSSGRRQAHWDEVTGVASQEGPDGWVLIMQHEDGEHTAVPLSVVDAAAVDVEMDVRDRLNEAHGYRPLT